MSEPTVEAIQLVMYGLLTASIVGISAAFIVLIRHDIKRDRAD